MKNKTKYRVLRGISLALSVGLPAGAALALTLSNVPERITDAESAVSLLRRAVEGEAELLLELLLATNLPEYRKEMLRDRFSALFPETGGTESSL